MKHGGLLFAALLLVGGVLRIAGPDALPLPRQLSTSSSATAKQSTTPSVSLAGAGKSAWELSLAEKIAESFSCSSETERKSADDAAHWNVPVASRDSVEFVISMVPDPVHTHLALSFDRTIEALELAVQENQRFVFDRAILPWSHTPGKTADSPEARLAGLQERRERETNPGLLIFRSSPGLPSDRGDGSGPGGCTSRRSLFVFLVAETPTGGIRAKQFQNALKIMREIRPSPLKNPVDRPLSILGPTFSGSLESLGRELDQIPPAQHVSSEFVYSGTITGAKSVDLFRARYGSRLPLKFVSFQENDEYAIRMFTRFALCQGYEPEEIAVLSEDDTVYGNQSSRSSVQLDVQPVVGTATCQDPSDDRKVNMTGHDLLYLHFPREISFFRSAYQKELVAESQADARSRGKTSLSVDFGDEGSNDDAVAPYAVGQTSLSQEAVMLGVVSELQKHHIKFTILLASSPIDQLFLSRYLRTSYPQGRVVVTSPDLLLISQEDTLLHGVLGLNVYSLVPGLSDSLCEPYKEQPIHEDRLFVATSSVGIYNAMLGLLAETPWPADEFKRHLDELSPAPYAEYGSPLLSASPPFGCLQKPLLWLTMVGRDGYWPIAALTEKTVKSLDGKLPVVGPLQVTGKPGSLMPTTLQLLPPQSNPARTTSAWNVAYCICFLALVVHAVLSWTGSFLSNSESQAQFARSHDNLAVLVLALGAFWLTTAFVLVMCTRSPLVTWKGFAFPGLTPLLWVVLPVFVAITMWDIGKHRNSLRVAVAFGALAFLMTTFQVLLANDSISKIPILWSTRVIHLASGVSPVLPFLLLFAAGYWWVWLSLRGMALVDLRRPRLPGPDTLPGEAVRISDTEGEQVRDTAHPVKLAWRILVSIFALVIIALTVLDLKHPLQSLEGFAYDWSYTVLLGTMIAIFVGCLMRLVLTWFKYKQILAGLDRILLRDAFSRMKRLSWRSMWNPGGSTLRETYRVMSRALENMPKLKAALAAQPSASTVQTAIDQTDAVRQLAFDEFKKLSPGGAPPPSADGKAQILDDLVAAVGKLQRQLADTAGLVIRDFLTPIWRAEQAPVVSEDERIKRGDLDMVRALAEEFVALTYVNFLQSVLLQMRTLVICAAGMYVLLVCSMNVYPFEPHPALQALSVILLFVMAAAVGFVYAEMHRDAILSRLTSTNAGELGWDFWLKFASAGAIPVFSLLAVQFPEINKLLFTWLQPALNAIK
jgi:hypothetical protein